MGTAMRMVVVACLAGAVPAVAGAQQVQRPTRYLIDVPARPVPPPQVVVVTTPPPPVVTTTVYVHDDPVAVDHWHDGDRDPYETAGVVVVGSGIGAAMFLGGDAPATTLAYRLHLGLAVGPAEFALAADLVPAISDQRALSMWSASFGYRFFDDADVHPVVGLGLEAIVLDDGARTRADLGAMARIGLELAFPLDDGAVAMGLDLVQHHALTGRD